tara:strand:+ start:119 stop:259 length:141 start_codon:yes stop_codon:yes gene_type:complete
MGENPLFSGFALKWLIRKKEKGGKVGKTAPLRSKAKGKWVFNSKKV